MLHDGNDKKQTLAQILNAARSAARSVVQDPDDLIQDSLVTWLENARDSIDTLMQHMSAARRKRERLRSAERRATKAWLSAQYPSNEPCDEEHNYTRTRNLQLNALRSVRVGNDQRYNVVLDDWGAGIPVRTTASQLGICPTRVMQIRSSLARKVTKALHCDVKEHEDTEPIVPNDDSLYDGLVLHARADSSFVRASLLPQLRAAGLRVATADDLLDPGMVRVVGLELALKRARKAVVVISSAYLKGESANDRFEDHLTIQRKDADIRSGRTSLIPAYLDDPESLPQAPGWLSSLTSVRLMGSSGKHSKREMNRLICALARR